MSNYLIQDSTLTDIADAIRAKSGSQATIDVADFATEIENLPSGGGGQPALTWKWTSPGNADNYTYTVPEDGTYIILVHRSGNTVTLPSGVTPLVNTILQQNRIVVADLEEGDTVSMYIYNSGKRGGMIFKANVEIDSLMYSRESSEYGDISYVNQGTNKKVISIIMGSGANRYYSWDDTMLAFIDGRGQGLYVRILYGTDSDMPTIVINGGYEAQYILEVAE